MTRTRPSFLGMTRHFINSRRDRRSIGVEHFWSKTLGRLADMVRSAKLNSRFYAELYKDIDPDNFTLEELPTTSKNLLMDNFDDVLTVRDVNYKQILDFTGDPAKVGQLLQGKYVVAHTSGTTGVRGYFINSMDEWAQTITQSLVPPAKAHILMLLDQVATLPVRPFKRWRALSIIATGGHYLSPLAYIFTPRLKDVLVDLKTVDLFTPVDDLVKLINEFKPTYLQSYPSVLHTLVLEAAAGRMTHKPRIVLGGAEPFPLEVKKLMLQVWPGVLVESCTELPSASRWPSPASTTGCTGALTGASSSRSTRTANRSSWER